MIGITTAGISIHAPLTGCDRRGRRNDRKADDFNPRTPDGVRQQYLTHCCFPPKISIHAPLTGCDRRRLLSLVATLLPQEACGGLTFLLRFMKLFQLAIAICENRKSLFLKNPNILLDYHIIMNY